MLDPVLDPAALTVIETQCLSENKRKCKESPLGSENCLLSLTSSPQYTRYSEKVQRLQNARNGRMKGNDSDYASKQPSVPSSLLVLASLHINFLFKRETTLPHLHIPAQPLPSIHALHTQASALIGLCVPTVLPHPSLELVWEVLPIPLVLPHSPPLTSVAALSSGSPPTSSVVSRVFGDHLLFRCHLGILPRG